MVNTGSNDEGDSTGSATTIDPQRLLAETFVAEVRYSPVLSSTQDVARMADAEGRPAMPLLVVADRQTAGRGRGDHGWWTGDGGLAFSLLFDPAPFRIAAEFRPRLALVAAVAVIDAVQPLVRRTVGLHWPNDVYVDGRKLAGILIEVLSSGRHILGIGLNANNSPQDAPAELRERVASLGSITGQIHQRTDVLVTVVKQIETKLAEFAAAPDEFGRRFDGLCLQHDQLVTVRAGNERVTGRCAGIRSDGALLVDTPQGRRSFTYGSLH